MLSPRLGGSIDYWCLLVFVGALHTQCLIWYSISMVILGCKIRFSPLTAALLLLGMYVGDHAVRLFREGFGYIVIF